MVSIQKIGLGPGLHFKTEACSAYVRGGAVTKGDVRMFDFGNDDTATTNMTPGDPASGFANVIVPTTNYLDCAVFGIAAEDAADDTLCKFVVKGRVLAQLAATTGVVTPLVAANAVATLAAAGGAGGEKLIGMPLEDGIVGTPTWVLFDGVNGFGNDTA